MSGLGAGVEVVGGGVAEVLAGEPDPCSPGSGTSLMMASKMAVIPWVLGTSWRSRVRVVGTVMKGTRPAESPCRDCPRVIKESAPMFSPKVAAVNPLMKPVSLPKLSNTSVDIDLRSKDDKKRC